MSSWGGAGDQLTLGNDQRFQLSLFLCPLHDFRLDGVIRDQPKDEDGFRLPDSVRSILSLEVHLWILWYAGSVNGQSRFQSSRLTQSWS